MQGISLIFVAAFVVANAVVDLLYAFLDPRVAMGAGRREHAPAVVLEQARGTRRRRSPATDRASASAR